ncbi:MAG: hypothetical protein R3E53_03485 [Myxococcota bacterium]
MHRYSGLAEPLLRAGGQAPSPAACASRSRSRAPCSHGATGEAVWQALADRYRGEPFVEAGLPQAPSPSTISARPTALNGTNRLRLHALPNAAGHVLLVGLLDNLGKGASGAAIQSLNLMLGLDETTGLPR